MAGSTSGTTWIHPSLSLSLFSVLLAFLLLLLCFTLQLSVFVCYALPLAIWLIAFSLGFYIPNPLGRCPSVALCAITRARVFPPFRTVDPSQLLRDTPYDYDKYLSRCFVYIGICDSHTFGFEERLLCVGRISQGSFIYTLEPVYAMTTTPPPPSALQMPPTPRHGAAYDQYEPYITRHSARIAGQRGSRTSTPPPSFPAFRTAAGSKSTKKEKNDSDEPEALSPPGSIHGSPRKKTSGRSRAYGPAHSLEDDTMGLTDPFTLSEPFSKQHPHSGFETTTTKTNGMLPTPAKTPKKKAVGDPGATARTLFPPSSMSGRPKKSKKHTGFSLDSFNEDTTQGRTQIAIYTDSRDRIPEVDESQGNLFYHPKEAQTTQTPGNPQPSRSSERRKAVEGKQEKKLERDHEIEDAVKRDDGMVYVL